MTKEQFIQVGVSEELATKLAEESAKELKNYIPLHRFEEVNNESKILKSTIKESERALEELKKSTGNSEELQQQIQKLQDEAKQAEQKHQDELKETKLNNAIKLAIAGKVHDEDLAISLFDKTKLVLDNEKIVGLDEQFKTLKETKSFLFREEKQETKAGFHKIGAEPQTSGQTQNSMNLKDAVASYFQTNNN